MARWSRVVAMSGEGDNPSMCHLCGAVDCDKPGHSAPKYPMIDEQRIVFALAIPHAPWMPGRKESLARLLASLGNRPVYSCIFDERAPNAVWARKLQEWGVEMGEKGATHLIQLQDDVVPMPGFWRVLRSMVEGNPEQWIGLHVNHPVAQQLAFVGRRWFRTRAWFVGPQWVAPLRGPHALANKLAWDDANGALPDGHPEKLTQFEMAHEDVGIGAWLSKTGRDVYHPIPAIADVDLTIESTYEGADGHIDDHRRPRVTWHGYRQEMLESKAYWELPSKTELFPGAGVGTCSFCNNEPGQYRAANFMSIGRMCLFHMMALAMGVAVRGETKGGEK